jgi:hypothetical protein
VLGRCEPRPEHGWCLAAAQSRPEADVLALVPDPGFERQPLAARLVGDRREQAG